MLVIVTAPDALYSGKIGGTFYLIPETAGESQKKAEYNEMVREAEAMREADRFGASLRMQAAYRFLVSMLAGADFITVDEVMKSEYNFGRMYALGMLGKLLRSALNAQQMKQFRHKAYQRIQKARYAMKNLVEKGLGDRWLENVKAGKQS